MAVVSAACSTGVALVRGGWRRRAWFLAREWFLGRPWFLGRAWRGAAWPGRGRHGEFVWCGAFCGGCVRHSVGGGVDGQVPQRGQFGQCRGEPVAGSALLGGQVRPPAAASGVQFAGNRAAEPGHYGVHGVSDVSPRVWPGGRGDDPQGRGQVRAGCALGLLAFLPRVDDRINGGPGRGIAVGGRVAPGVRRSKPRRAPRRATPPGPERRDCVRDLETMSCTVTGNGASAIARRTMPKGSSSGRSTTRTLSGIRSGVGGSISGAHGPSAGVTSTTWTVRAGWEVCGIQAGAGCRIGRAPGQALVTTALTWVTGMRGGTQTPAMTLPAPLPWISRASRPCR